MLEFPEVMNVSRQLREVLFGKTVRVVLPPTKLHKFCWFNGAPDLYNDKIVGAEISDVVGFGLYVELNFSNGLKLCFNDGINVRYMNQGQTPSNFQLLIEFDDDSFLVFTTAMYGSIILHDNDYSNEYYVKSKNAVSVWDSAFEDYFHHTYVASKPKLSVKAFLATEQRFPGIGNGVLQDILFTAGIHPKQKIELLSSDEINFLKDTVVSVLLSMTQQGGRDTEKDIFGNFCGYRTLLSSKTYPGCCPRCGLPIVKEAYLGGSVYYCPECQRLKE